MDTPHIHFRLERLEESDQAAGAGDTLGDPQIWISTPRDALERLRSMGGVLGGRPVAKGWQDFSGATCWSVQRFPQV